MSKAAGCFGKPGISKIEPVETTINPAPFFKAKFLTCKVKFVGAPKTFLSSLKLYCVLATMTGSLSLPNSFKCSI